MLTILFAINAFPKHVSKKLSFSAGPWDVVWQTGYVSKRMQFLLCRPTFHYPMRHLPVNYQYSIGKNHHTLLLLWRHRTVSRVLLSSSLSPTAPTVVLVKHKLASVQPLDRLDLRLGIRYSLSRWNMSWSGQATYDFGDDPSYSQQSGKEKLQIQDVNAG